MEIKLKNKGLFITATGTEIGKTVIACAIAQILADAGVNVGVSKPVASGCNKVNDQLINDDALALQKHSRTSLSLNTINPVQYEQPLAPAVAAKLEGIPINARSIKRSLQSIDNQSDITLVEGVGGILVPLSSRVTVLDLAVTIGYPVLVVTRPNLGTLNETALTCKAIKQAGLKLAGIIINQYPDQTDNLAIQTNPTWLGKQSRTNVLATVPQVSGFNPVVDHIPQSIINSLSSVNWKRICKPQHHV